MIVVLGICSSLDTIVYHVMSENLQRK